MVGLSTAIAVDFPPPKTVIISRIQHLPLFRSEFFLRQKYLEERLSTHQIASLIFSSKSTILSYLKKFGIPLRTEDEAHKLHKGQIGYGQKRRAGQEVIHLREAEVVKKMQALRRQGHSYWKIASILTTMKVPTKNRKGRWQANTVMKILKTADACIRVATAVGE